MQYPEQKILFRRTTQSPLLRHCCAITRSRRMRSYCIISSALDRFLHNAHSLNKQPPPEHISNGGILFSLRPLNQAFCLFRDFWVILLKMACRTIICSPLQTGCICHSLLCSAHLCHGNGRRCSSSTLRKQI